MDEFKELEKYKQLLDAGAITEDEFRKVKQSLLGLKTDEEKNTERQRQREEALAEIEAMKQARMEKTGQKEQQCAGDAESKIEQLEKQSQMEEQYQQIYSAEKAKELARLEAVQEKKQQDTNERMVKFQTFAKSAASVIGVIILWILSVICVLFGVTSIIGMEKSTIKISGAVLLLMAVMICPLITKETKKYEKLAFYNKNKKFFIIAAFVLWFVFLSL